MLSRNLVRSALRPAFRTCRGVRFESGKTNAIPRAEDGLPEKTSAIGKEFQQARAVQKDWNNPILTYEQVKAKSLSPIPNAYLIDVREPEEVLQGSIPSSVNMPLSSLAADIFLNATAFKERFGFEKPEKDQEITFYCRSGMRSASACDIAKRNGFTNVSSYKGSWLDWVEREATKST